MHAKKPLIRRLLRLTGDRRGGIAVLAGLSFTILVGLCGLVAEYGYGLVLKTENQRVADLTAYAGGLAYNANNSTTSMTSAVSNLASLNGVASTAASGALGTSPSGDGNSAVATTVSTSASLVLSAIINSAATTLSAGAASSAEVKTSSSPCMIALSSSGTGVTLSGGTNATAPSCGVSSNSTVSVPCGTKVTTVAITYNTTAPSQPCNGIVAPTGKSVSIKKSNTTDPLSGNTNVSSATGRLSTVSNQAARQGPSVQHGTDITFGSNTSQTQTAAKAIGCSATYASNTSTWTMTCTGTTVNCGNITVSGGVNLNFNTNGSSSTTYNISGQIYHGGGTAAFGPGTYNIAQGITTTGGSTATFAGGTYNIGQSTSGCNGWGEYSICHAGSKLTFNGTSTFNLSSGVHVCGGATASFGSGSSNSYDLGKSTDGNSVYIEGGCNVTLADATASASVFKAEGNLNLSNGGGSCVTLPAATNHDVNGYMATAGGMTLGSGTYTVTGFIGFGTDQYGDSSGGDVTCGGSQVGVTGNNVTLVAGGNQTPGGNNGSCSGRAFCVSGGYGHVTLTAPTSGSMEDLCVIGPKSGTAGAALAQGSSNTSVSGAFYFPNGALTLSGAGSIGNGRCLQIVASQIALSGGSASASNCPGTGSGTTAAGVQLVK